MTHRTIGYSDRKSLLSLRLERVRNLLLSLKEEALIKVNGLPEKSQDLVLRFKHNY